MRRGAHMEGVAEWKAIAQPSDSDIYQMSMDDIMCELGFGSLNTDEQSTVLQARTLSHVIELSYSLYFRGGGQMPSLRGPYWADLHLASPPLLAR